jgi:hypothetical protein
VSISFTSIMAYHFYGDSNIARFLSVVKNRSPDPQYQTLTLTKTTNLVNLRDALSKPEVCHSTIVISALTNLLTSKYFDDYAKMLEHCKNTFHDVLSWVQEGRNHLDGFAAQVGVHQVLYLGVKWCY